MAVKLNFLILEQETIVSNNKFLILIIMEISNGKEKQVVSLLNIKTVRDHSGKSQTTVCLSVMFMTVVDIYKIHVLKNWK